MLLEDRSQKLFFRTEIVVQEPLRRFQLEGNVVHARALVAARREDAEPRVEDAATSPRGAFSPEVGAQRGFHTAEYETYLLVCQHAGDQQSKEGSKGGYDEVVGAVLLRGEQRFHK